MPFCLAFSFWSLALATSAFFDGLEMKASRTAAAVGLWVQTDQEQVGGAPLAGFPLSLLMEL